MLKLVLTGYDSVDVDRWQAAADRVAGIEIVETLLLLAWLAAS